MLFFQDPLHFFVRPVGTMSIFPSIKYFKPWRPFQFISIFIITCLLTNDELKSFVSDSLDTWFI